MFLNPAFTFEHFALHSKRHFEMLSSVILFTATNINFEMPFLKALCYFPIINYTHNCILMNSADFMSFLHFRFLFLIWYDDFTEQFCFEQF